MVGTLRAVAATLALLIGTTTFAVAQRPRVEAGLLGGLASSRLVGGLPTDRQHGGHLAAFVRVPVEGAFAFRTEIGVVRRETSYSGAGAACPADWLCLSLTAPGVERVTFTWVEVPLLAEWQPTRRLVGGVTPALFAGPFLAVRLGGVSCTRDGPPSVPDGVPPMPGPEETVLSSCDGEFAPDGAEPAATGDAGFVLGGVLRRGSVGLGARWTRSLTDAVRPSFADASRLAGSRQSTLTLFVEVTPFARR